MKDWRKNTTKKTTMRSCVREKSDRRAGCNTGGRDRGCRRSSGVSGAQDALEEENDSAEEFFDEEDFYVEEDMLTGKKDQKEQDV